MQRGCTILIAISVLALLTGQTSYAAFSAFARITPETEAWHHLYTQILPVEGQDDKCKIMPPSVPPWRSIYLIVCNAPVPPEEQSFRSHIWSQGESRTDVLMTVPLLPYGQYALPDLQRVIPPIPNHIILDRSLLERSYLYIDYPKAVLDGGFYYCVDLSTYPLPEERTMQVRYSPAEGLGPEPGVMRRDPSDIIKVGDLYYVWYTKSNVPHGYDATVWYATSPDGHTWTEKGEALPRGPEGSWDEQSVFTPNILIAKGRYYLFYTGVPKPFYNEGNQVTETAIGVAVADSPDGPWEKSKTNPILEPVDPQWRDFDSMRVDDACLLVRDGKYWLYYKGRRWDDTPGHTEMGLAVAEEPEGPYVRYVANPVVEGGHEVLVWPLGTGVAAMVNIGPEGIAKTLQYAPDGLSFSRMMNLDEVPSAPAPIAPKPSPRAAKGR